MRSLWPEGMNVFESEELLRATEDKYGLVRFARDSDEPHSPMLPSLRMHTSDLLAIIDPEEHAASARVLRARSLTRANQWWQVRQATATRLRLPKKTRPNRDQENSLAPHGVGRLRKRSSPITSPFDITGTRVSSSPPSMDL